MFSSFDIPLCAKAFRARGYRCMLYNAPVPLLPYRRHPELSSGPSDRAPGHSAMKDCASTNCERKLCMPYFLQVGHGLAISTAHDLTIHTRRTMLEAPGCFAQHPVPMSTLDDITHARCVNKYPIVKHSFEQQCLTRRERPIGRMQRKQLRFGKFGFHLLVSMGTFKATPPSPICEVTTMCSRRAAPKSHEDIL